MSVALSTILPLDIVSRISDFAQRHQTFNWETVYGSTVIYKTKHILTYGGGPEGGYVYFYREREPGWYAWERTWGTAPTYTKLEGLLVQKFEDDIEYVSVVPPDYEPEEEDDAEITILDKYVMEEGLLD